MDRAEIVSLAFSIVGFVVSLASITINYYYNKKLEVYKKDLEDRQRRLVRYEDVQELMVQYKKPLVQSAFDLQSRLTQQVTRNFLYTFKNQERRRAEYARNSMAYLLCEFLGWLEVIRQEIVFVMGKQAETLSGIIDAIKFQFTGEEAVQGVMDPREAQLPDVEERDWSVLQLFAAELRAIGEVMIVARTYDDDKDVMSTGLSVIGFAEFTRRLKERPERQGREGNMVLATMDGKLEPSSDSKDELFRDTIAPLMRSVDRLMEMRKPPTERLAMLQVLLCKLIDFLDTDDNALEGPGVPEKRYLPRDRRMTPLVAYLKPPALRWLVDQEFMQDCEADVHESCREQWRREVDREELWRSAAWDPAEGGAGVPKSIFRVLAFPGFRKDLSGLQPLERLTALKAAHYPGAFPPRHKPPKRPKPIQWAVELGRRLSLRASAGGVAGAGAGGGAGGSAASSARVNSISGVTKPHVVREEVHTSIAQAEAGGARRQRPNPGFSTMAPHQAAAAAAFIAPDSGPAATTTDCIIAKGPSAGAGPAAAVAEAAGGAPVAAAADRMSCDLPRGGVPRKGASTEVPAAVIAATTIDGVCGASVGADIRGLGSSGRRGVSDAAKAAAWGGIEAAGERGAAAADVGLVMKGGVAGNWGGGGGGAGCLAGASRMVEDVIIKVE